MAERTGRRIDVPPGEVPVLVAIVPRRADWTVLRAERWYRIPVDKAPEGLDKTRYLAFYQTKAFGPERWSVNYYTPVHRITIARRIELLPGEPRHARAQNRYYRIDLGELESLPAPIPSRRLRRIVFIPTTLRRLLTAREINDLFSGSLPEDELYAALKDEKLPAEREFFVRESGRGAMLDFAVFCQDGKLDVECDGEAYHSGKEKAEHDRTRDNTLTCAGWRILRFSAREILDDPDICIHTIRRAVRKLGGVERLPG